MNLRVVMKSFLLGLSLTMLATAAVAEWYKAEQAIMGTEIALEIWEQNSDRAKNCADEVFSEMRRIDALMSPYKVDSELSKVNRLAADQPVAISSELFNLISESLKYSRLSSGAFDITFSSVGYLYDYRNKQQPSNESIKKLLPAIDYRHLLLDEKLHTISFTMQGVRIDLGGIAKGYAIDNAVSLLHECGIKNGFVKAGGDSFVLGDRNGQPWMLGIKHPRQEDKVVVKLPLRNVAVSTSGDYERYFIENGERVHHIIRPTTGRPVTENWSVTVIGNHALETDALSTTLFVMDVNDALNLVNSLEDIDAIIIDAKGNMHYSEGLSEPQSHE